MRRLLCVFSVCSVFAGLPLVAETHLDVSQLAAQISAAVAVDRDDLRIARSLKSVRLTEQLTPETAALLVGLGVGAGTVRALEAIRKHSARLAPPRSPVLSITPVPSDPQQEEIVAKIRQYAADYMARFPNFIATETVRQYHNYHDVNESVCCNIWKKIPHIDDVWHMAANYTIEAAYVSGHERLAKAPVNGQQPAHEVRVSAGEFGGMLEEIFDPSRNAAFVWDHWQVLSGIRTAVFSYQVSSEFSRYSICCRGAHLTEWVKAGHRGFVFADPKSGTIMRLILVAAGLNENTGVTGAAHVMDYGNVTIDTVPYVLPLRSIAYVRIGPYESREEIEYSRHHKFGTESEISFEGEDNPKAPN